MKVYFRWEIWLLYLFLNEKAFTLNKSNKTYMLSEIFKLLALYRLMWYNNAPVNVNPRLPRPGKERGNAVANARYYSFFIRRNTGNAIAIASSHARSGTIAGKWLFEIYTLGTILFPVSSLHPPACVSTFNKWQDGFGRIWMCFWDLLRIHSIASCA